MHRSGWDLVVLQDADLQLAVQNAVIGAFLFQGQICMSSSRIIVEQAVADDFLQALAARTEQLGHGDLRDPATMTGPIINDRQRQRIRRHLDDAIARGARVVTGNVWQDNRLLPTILTEVSDEAVLQREETFGPVVPIVRVPSAHEEIMKISNSTAFGLSAGVCTNRIDTATKFVNGLHVGTVNIWEVPGYRIELSPFGGVKDSGLGYKEGVWEAMKSYTNVKTYSLPWPA